MKKIMLVIASLISASALAFAPNMKEKQIDQEVKILLSQGYTPKTIISKGIEQGATLDEVVASLERNGVNMSTSSGNSDAEFHYATSNTPSSYGGGGKAVSPN